MLPCAQLSFEHKLTVFCTKILLQIPRRLSFAERKVSLQVGQAGRTGGNAQTCVPMTFEVGIYMKVGEQEGKGLGSDWWEVRGSFKSSLHRHDCPSYLCMDHMCNFGGGRSLIYYMQWIFILWYPEFTSGHCSPSVCLCDACQKGL